MGFVVGSFPTPEVLSYIDLSINVLCLAKIAIIHGFLFAHNSRVEGDKYKEEDKQDNKMRVFFINNIEKYEFLQILSIILTPLCLAYWGQPLIGQIFPALKTLRLFFPLFINRKKYQYLRLNVFLHIFKLTLFSGLFILILSLHMGLFFANTHNYYCMSDSQIIELTEGTIDPTLSKEFQSCGMARGCTGEA